MRKKVDIMSRLFLTIFLNTVLEDWGQIHCAYCELTRFVSKFLSAREYLLPLAVCFLKVELRFPITSVSIWEIFTLIVQKSRVYPSFFINNQEKSRLCESAWKKVDSVGTAGISTQIFWKKALIADRTHTSVFLLNCDGIRSYLLLISS